MFRTLINPSSGACDYSVELPYWSYCSWFDVCWSFGVAGLEWYSRCSLKLQPATRIPLQPNNSETPTHIECMLRFRCGWFGVVSVLQAETQLYIQAVLQPATPVPLQPNHTETPTHIEPRTIRPMW